MCKSAKIQCKSEDKIFFGLNYKNKKAYSRNFNLVLPVETTCRKYPRSLRLCDYVRLSSALFFILVMLKKKVWIVVSNYIQLYLFVSVIKDSSFILCIFWLIFLLYFQSFSPYLSLLFYVNCWKFKCFESGALRMYIIMMSKKIKFH